MAEPASELFSLLAPLVDARLLLPRVCIADITGYVKPVPLPASPPWLLGTTPWNGRPLPVISFEGACRIGSPKAGPRARIAVCVGLTDKLEARHFGIVTQGFPQLVTLNPRVVSNDAEQPDDRLPVLCRLRMANERPYVPDIEMLEGMLAEHLGA